MEILAKVKRNSLSEQVVDQLKGFISTNSLEPGTRLPSERDLTEMLGCSRSAVREALKSLETLGIITIQVGKGVFVSDRDWATIAGHYAFLLSPELEDFNHVMEARIAIENSILDLVIEKLTDDDVERLREITDRFAEVVTPEQDRELDLEFHETLVDIVDNPLLTEFSGLIRSFFAAIVNRTPTVGGRVARIEDHKKLLAVIASRDKEQAKSIMTSHIMAWQDVLYRHGYPNDN